MRRKIFAAQAVFSCFAFCIFAKSSPLGCRIELPSWCFQGDFRSVFFYAPSENYEGAVKIVNADGKKISEAKAFSSGRKNGEKIAVVAISTFCKAGDFSIEAELRVRGKLIFSKKGDFVVKKVEYESEELFLDEKNTAIKSDASPERARQIERLNAILFNADKNAARILGKFSMPVETKRQTAHFGDRRVYRYSGGGKAENVHYGNDYGVPTGTPVKSCAAGRVVMAENRISTGWSVVIEHFPGVYSLYYHMSELKCGVGDILRQSALIGLSGATGLATGPHLHWEVRVNGEAVSPDFFRVRGIGDRH